MFQTAEFKANQNNHTGMAQTFFQRNTFLDSLKNLALEQPLEFRKKIMSKAASFITAGHELMIEDDQSRKQGSKRKT